MQHPPQSSLASCLCVTEDRPAFLPWLLWNYGKQDHGARELVIVDSSRVPAAMHGDADVRVVRCAPGTNVAAKRNLALDAARGDVITWFDDDDWQHPRKLSILVEALGADDVMAGPVRSWFVDVKRSRARQHGSHRTVLFNGLGVRRDTVDGVRFDERRARAADTAWASAVRRSSQRLPKVVPEVTFFWLCHAGNISNPATRYVFPHTIGAVRSAIGAAAWGDTDDQLEALRGRLAGVIGPAGRSS